MNAFVNEIPHRDNMFEALTMEIKIAPVVNNRPRVISYFVNEYPRISANEKNPVQFVYGLFERDEVAFTSNQVKISNIGNQMFSDSRSLTTFEEDVLNYTFNRLVRKTPYRKNRT